MHLGGGLPVGGFCMHLGGGLPVGGFCKHLGGGLPGGRLLHAPRRRHSGREAWWRVGPGLAVPQGRAHGGLRCRDVKAQP
eukprot:352926-Chlamydomonas_euryale.AAC.13